MSRKPIISDVLHCNTLFQWALITLYSELEATFSELSDSLGVNKNNLAGWLGARSFPSSEELFYNMVEQYPIIGEAGSYGVQRADYREFRENPTRPTKGLIAFMKTRGFTYYKSKGQFDVTIVKLEEVEASKKVTEFRAFTEAAKSDSPQGRKLIEMLTSVIGEIPEDEDIDMNCIKDQRTYDMEISILEDKINTLQGELNQLYKANFLLRKLRMEYERLTTVGISRDKLEKEESEWLLMQSRLISK